jgi:hypothetical protein
MCYGVCVVCFFFYGGGERLELEVVCVFGDALRR